MRPEVAQQSGDDAGEMALGDDIEPPPHYIVSTGGKEGGQWAGEDHTTGSWKTSELPGPKRDAYGAGDSFAAGLTYALGAGMEPDDALHLAARAGASKLTGRAPSENQLTAAEL